MLDMDFKDIQSKTLCFMYVSRVCASTHAPFCKFLQLFNRCTRMGTCVYDDHGTGRNQVTGSYVEHVMPGNVCMNIEHETVIMCAADVSDARHKQNQQ